MNLVVLWFNRLDHLSILTCVALVTCIDGLFDYNSSVAMVACLGGSYSDVVAEVSNRDTLGGEEVESSELLNEHSKRKRVYPSAGVSVV